MKKKILLLGGFGFIGTNLTEELIKRGGYDISIFEAEKVIIQNPELLKMVDLYYGDFHKVEDYEVIFREKKIDLVVHLISTTDPALSNENIIFDIDSNLINTINLLNILVKYNCKNIIFLSSGGTVYGNSMHKDKKKESDSTNPICSYGIVKLTIEKYLYLYNYLYGLNYLILRPSNPFGEYHINPHQGLINVFLKKILNNETVEVWGDGTVIRDYIYIKDLVRIIVELIENEIQNDIINVGSGKGYSINTIIKIIQKEFGNFNLEYKDARKVDIPHLILNIDKLERHLDLNLTSIEEGIKKTFDWLKKV